MPLTEIRKEVSIRVLGELGSFLVLSVCSSTVMGFYRVRVSTDVSNGNVIYFFCSARVRNILDGCIFNNFRCCIVVGRLYRFEVR